MASKCSRFMSRRSIFSIKSASSSTTSSSPSSTAPSLRRAFDSSPLRRFSLSRSPTKLGCVQSLLPLHSVVAAARMTSCLSTTSRSCRALSQELGLSVPR